jgi:hypothetical protein
VEKVQLLRQGSATATSSAGSLRGLPHTISCVTCQMDLQRQRTEPLSSRSSGQGTGSIRRCASSGLPSTRSATWTSTLPRAPPPSTKTDSARGPHRDREPLDRATGTTPSLVGRAPTARYSRQFTPRGTHRRLPPGSRSCRRRPASRRRNPDRAECVGCRGPIGRAGRDRGSRTRRGA